MKLRFWLFIIVICFFSCDFIHKKNELKEVSRNDFKELKNLELLGVVYSLEDGIRGYHGRGIVRVNILSSNIDFYDPRNKQANYYCIIKNGKAEIYEDNLAYIEIGDTIFVKARDRIAVVYNGETGKNRLRSISIYRRNFFDYIYEKDYQEL